MSRPTMIYVSKGGFRGPHREHNRREFEILCHYLDLSVIGTGSSRFGGGCPHEIPFPAIRPRFLGGLIFYLVAPLVAVLLAVGKRVTLISTKSPYEAIGVAAARRILPRRARPLLVVEIHGDWRTASRLYGSKGRILVSPLSDRAARWALCHADVVRVIGEYTEGLVRRAGYEGPILRFLPFSDYSIYLEQDIYALPDRPQAVFVGALERYKGIDLLLAAWKQVISEVPSARLVIAGTGSLRSHLENEIDKNGLASSIDLLGAVPRERVRELLDASWCLALPSRSEGLGRVVYEAQARGRPTVASNVGGIYEVLDDSSTGLLVRPEDPIELARALTLILSDREQTSAMGKEARNSVEERNLMNEYERCLASFVEHIAKNL